MLKVIELFSGIGSQTEGLKRLQIEHEVVAICEIDKHAYSSYIALHGPTLNLGDITKVQKLPYCDLLTYSFPCQDLSVAGTNKGIIPGTRSGLLLEVERLLRGYAEKPKFLLLENVKNLIHKHKASFMEWLDVLDSLGYSNYWQVLDSADFDVPQNRHRVFVVSVRKDIDNGYTFPSPIAPTRLLLDILEDDVPEKYFITTEKAQIILDQQRNNMKFIEDIQNADDTFVAACITPLKLVKRQNGRRFKTNGEPMFTLTTQDRHGILLRNKHSLNYLGSVSERDWIKDGKQLSRNAPQGYRVYDSEGLSSTITASGGGLGSYSGLYFVPTDFVIRRLTPRECWRLQGQTDEAYDKASEVCSETQLYKQAGNSIVVDVLVAIFESLFKTYPHF